MKNFKQYINENNQVTQREILLGIKEKVEQAPHNFIWTYENLDEEIVENTVVAVREYEHDIMAVGGFGHYIYGENDMFEYMIEPTTSPGDDVFRESFTYPYLRFLRIPHIYSRPSAINILASDMDKIIDLNLPLFTRNLCTCELGQRRDTIHFKIYNYYLTTHGTKAQRAYDTLLFAKEEWIKSNYYQWDADSENILLRFKFKYFPKDQLTKRDYIRGALSI